MTKSKGQKTRPKPLKEQDGRPAEKHNNGHKTAPSTVAETTKSPFVPSWSSVSVFFLTTSVSLAIYLKTVAPTVVGGDTGELLAEACQLGTAHPPGYPLYTMLGYLVTHYGPILWKDDLPPAFYANCLSCVLGALASGFVSATVVVYWEATSAISRATVARHNKKNTSSVMMSVLPEATALAVGLLHTLSPTVWLYSVTAEVFALHNFFVGLLLYVSVRFAATSNASLTPWLYTGALVCGLALTNQHTTILLEIPIILWVAYETQLFSDPAKFLRTTLCFLLGLSLYLYLPIAAMYRPHRGAWGDVTTVMGVFNHMRRKDYGSLKLFSGKGAEEEFMGDRFVMWLNDFAMNQAGHAGVALLFLYGSGVVLWKFYRYVASTIPATSRSTSGNKAGTEERTSSTFESRMATVGFVWLAALGFYILVFFSLSNLAMSLELHLGVLKRFWMQPNTICFVLAAIGTLEYGTNIPSSNRSSSSSSPSSWRPLVILILAVATVLYAYWKNVEMSDQTDNFYMYNFGRATLETLPSGALLLCNADPDWNTVRYLQECEGVRPDVTTITMRYMDNTWWKKQKELFSNVNFPGDMLVADDSEWREKGGYTFTEFLNANYDDFDGKIFVSLDLKVKDALYKDHWKEVPHGLVEHLVPEKDVVQDAEEYRKASLVPWRQLTKFLVPTQLPDTAKYNGETWEFWVRNHFFEKMRLRASYLLNLGSQGDGSEDPVLHSLMESVAWLEMIVANNGEHSNFPATRKNMAIGYLQMKRNVEEAYAEDPPELEDIFRVGNDTSFMDAISDVWWNEGTSWKAWISYRWYAAFGEFLETPGAESEAEYETIKEFYGNARVVKNS